MEAYPELNASYVFPDEVTEQLQTGKKKRKPKDLEEIESRLRESLKTQRFMDYTNIELKLDNEQTCMETLKELDKAEEDAKKRVVYLSCLKGRVLERFKEITGKKMYQLLRLTPYKKSYAYFLIKMYDLASEYNKVMYSDLPVRYFQINFKEIKTICERYPIFLKIYKRFHFPTLRKYCN